MALRVELGFRFLIEFEGAPGICIFWGALPLFIPAHVLSYRILESNLLYSVPECCGVSRGLSQWALLGWGSRFDEA